MVVAWGLLLPVGAMYPRLRILWPGERWFLYHRRIQTATVLCAGAGYLVIFLAPERIPYEFKKTHARVGFGMLGLLVAQPLLAWLRPSKSSLKWRSLWRTQHILTAALLFGGATWQMWTGPRLTSDLEVLTISYVLLLLVPALAVIVGVFFF